MKAALLLIDVQHDFLRAPGLAPAPGQIVGRVAALLQAWRSLGLPVIHCWTSVDPQSDRRMPHWKAAGRWLCVTGSAGHAPPHELQPLPPETVVSKTFYSAFADPRLEATLAAEGCDTLVVAGLYLHACVRATVLDAYQRGLTVYVAEDAVGSDDPLHAAVSRRYLEDRAIRFAPVQRLEALLRSPAASEGRCSALAPVLPALHLRSVAITNANLPAIACCSPRREDTTAFRVPVCGREDVALAVGTAREAWPLWRESSPGERGETLLRVADMLEQRTDSFARQIAIEVGKPISQARGEVARSAALFRAAVDCAASVDDRPCEAGVRCRQRPLGAIALVTPFNNPLGIAAGKLAPALVYGNTVVWKPALAGSGVAHALMDLLAAAGVPAGVVGMVCGTHSTARALMQDSGVDAVTLTGGEEAGFAAQDICARRRVPLQAELGGNNAAIVWSDCDLQAAARRVAEGAFGFAGQRCTANRRAIVDERCLAPFMDALEAATAALEWGDPLEPATQVGPLVSAEARRRVAGVVARALGAGLATHTPHCPEGLSTEGDADDAYYPPTIVRCDGPGQEIAQEETFGPVLVIQRAREWRHALELCNGVRQGLAAALFSESPELQASFLAEAQAGILKLNEATSDAGVTAPFGGWKASGIGPPEHGASDREFYSRTQAVYGPGA